MSLPFSRNTTYTPASPIKSVDLNDIQDCIIDGKHGDVWRSASLPAFKQNAGDTLVNTDGYLQPAASVLNRVFAAMPVFPGEEVVEVVARIDRGGAGAVQVKVTAWDGTGAGLEDVIATLNGSGTGFATLTSGAVSYTVAAHGSVYVWAEMNNIANKIAAVLCRVRKQ
jgi:hypothetical protein